jgi:hypothetical protein
VRVVEDADQAAQQVALAAHGGYGERDPREINLQTQEVHEARAQIEEQDLARVLLGAGDVGGDTGELLRDLLGGPVGERRRVLQGPLRKAWPFCTVHQQESGGAQRQADSSLALHLCYLLKT